MNIMEKTVIDLGSYLTCITIDKVIVSGEVVAIFQNIVVIKDKKLETHLLKKSDIVAYGYAMSDSQTALYGNRNPGISKN